MVVATCFCWTFEGKLTSLSCQDSAQINMFYVSNLDLQQSEDALKTCQTANLSSFRNAEQE